MKHGGGEHFEQSYNAQAAVEVQSRLVVSQLVSDAPNDKEQLVPVLENKSPVVQSLSVVLVDSGYYSEAAIRQVEVPDADTGVSPQVYAATRRHKHGRSVKDIEQHDDPPPPPPGAPVKAIMEQRLETQEGKASTGCASRRWNLCLASSNLRWAFVGSACAGSRKWGWSGRWSRSVTISSVCITLGQGSQPEESGSSELSGGKCNDTAGSNRASSI